MGGIDKTCAIASSLSSPPLWRRSNKPKRMTFRPETSGAENSTATVWTIAHAKLTERFPLATSPD